MHDAPTPPHTSAVHLAVTQLTQCLDAVRGDSEATPERRATALAAIESDLFLVLSQHAEDESLRGDRAHPALATAEAWRDEAHQLACPEQADDAETFVEELIGDEARRWREARDDAMQALARGEGLGEAMSLLLQATALDRESLARDADHDWVAPVGDARQPLQEAVRTHLRDHRPDAIRRARWARSHIDAADEVLTSLDELTPPVAAQHLSMVAQGITWHRRHVESRKGEDARALKRKERRLRVEGQERQLQASLERRFGSRNVARFERLVLWLIFLVMGILVYELTDPPQPVRDRPRACGHLGLRAYSSRSSS